jgi:hypothetical protein
MDLDYIERKRGFFYDFWLIIKTVGVTIGMMFGKDGGAE